ncbi:MAG: Cna B-type domain-containing protein [Blautia sp.]|nr:Cna B-type domain-containing protein [Blautia sp.]
MKKRISLLLCVFLCFHLIVPSFVYAEYADMIETVSCNEYDSGFYHIEETQDAYDGFSDEIGNDNISDDIGEENIGDIVSCNELPADMATFAASEDTVDALGKSDEDYVDEDLWGFLSEADVMDWGLVEGERTVGDTSENSDEDTVTVTFRDCDNHSERDAFEEAGKNLLDYVCRIPAGTSLADYWASGQGEEPYTMLDVPKRRLREIVWNTEEGEAFDLSTPVTRDMVLSSKIFCLKLYDLKYEDDSSEEAYQEITVLLRVGDHVGSVLNQTTIDPDTGEEVPLYQSEYDGAVLGQCVWIDADGNPVEELLDTIVTDDFAEASILTGDLEIIRVETADVDEYDDTYIGEAAIMMASLDDAYDDDLEEDTDEEDSFQSELYDEAFYASEMSDIMLADAATHTVTFNFPNGTSTQIPVADGGTLTKEQLTDAAHGDYRLYIWNNGTADVELSTMSVTSDLTLTGTAIITNPVTSPQTVHYFVLLDDTWTEVGTGTLQGLTNKFNDGQNRMFVTSEQLEEAFGAYGFDADTYQGGQIFPHVDHGGGSIWFTTPKQLNGLQLVKTLTHNLNAADVFYLPGQTKTTTGSLSKSNKDLPATDPDSLKPYGFYTVKWIDPSTGAEHVEYVQYGQSITVDLPDGYEWVTKDNAGNILSGPEELNSITLNNVTHPYVLTALGAKYVVGDPISPMYGAVKSDFANMSIDGNVMPQQGALTFQGDGTVVKAPDHDHVVVTKPDRLGNPIATTYDFKGWKLGSGNNIVYLQPGDVISQEMYDRYANPDTGVLELQGVWSAKDQNENYINVNFYVCIDGTVMDTAGQVTGKDKNRFTGCVYTTRIIGTEDLGAKITGNNYSILSTDTTDYTAREIDGKIRTLDSEAVTATFSGNEASVLLQSVPSDEYVMAKLQEWQRKNHNITIDNVQVDADKLTPDYYTVRWYVLKYDDSDAWHIDGIILQKQGQIRVTKTFTGDEDAIRKAKENFSIRMGTAAAASAEDISLRLDASTGLTVSEDQKTYTWIQEVRPSTTYYIKEENYVVERLEDNTQIDTRSMYSVYEGDNPIVGGSNPYQGQAVTVDSKVYPIDMPPDAIETVNFTNMYMPRGSLLLKKVDQASGGGIGNVEFTMTTNTQPPITTLWKNPNSNDYSFEHVEGDAYTQSVSRITTDANGEIRLNNVPADMQFTFTEITPEGYESIQPIQIVSRMNAQNDIEFTLNSHEKASLNGSLLLVENAPKKANMTIRKEWGNTPENYIPGEVTVQLYRRIGENGTLEPTSKIVTISADNNWSKVITDLPLYQNGQRITEYTLRETRIGDAATGVEWSSVYDGGYNDWTVTVSDPVYKSGGNTQASMEVNGVYADTIEYTVKNEPFVHEFTLYKTDQNNQPVPGAVFKIYGNEGTMNFRQLDNGAYEYAADNASGSVVTTRLVAGADGTITIRGLNMADGYRFELQEKEVPLGYDADKAWPVRITLIKNGIGTAAVIGSVPEGYQYVSKTEDGQLSIVNQSVASVEIEKDLINVDTDQTEFDFAIRSSSLKEGDTYSYTLTSGEQTSVGTATFTGGEMKVKLRKGDRIRFDNLPGGTYTVEEVNLQNPYFFDSATSVITDVDGVEGTPTEEKRSVTKVLRAGDVWSLHYDNGKNPAVQTGILQDFVPYMIIILITLIGATLLVGRMLLYSRRRDGDG